MASAMESLFPKHYLESFLIQGIRPDARQFQFFRPTAYSIGNIRSADGSSTVQIGSTSVVAGVVLCPTAIPAGSKKQGKINVSVELSPFCSAKFQVGGRQNEQAISLSQFMNRILESADVLSLDDLLVSDDVAWVLNVSVTCTSFDGNITDSALLSIVVALLNTRIPAAVVNSKGQVVETDSPPRTLVLKSLPLSLTLATFDCQGSNISVVDPTSSEEDTSDSVLTVVVLVQNNGAGLNSQKPFDESPVIIHKPGGMALQPSVLKEAVIKARIRAKELVELIRQDVKH